MVRGKYKYREIYLEGSSTWGMSKLIEAGIDTQLSRVDDLQTWAGYTAL
jgi:hypothetical protein